MLHVNQDLDWLWSNQSCHYSQQQTQVKTFRLSVVVNMFTFENCAPFNVWRIVFVPNEQLKRLAIC